MGRSDIKIFKECEGEYKLLGNHLKSHNMTKEEYHRKHIRKEGEGICKAEGCNNETKLHRNIYSSTCSQSCKFKMVHSNMSVEAKNGFSDRLTSYNKSEEHREIASKTMSERNKDPKFIGENAARISSTMSTPEFRQYNSNRVKGYYSNPGNKEKIKLHLSKSAKSRFILQSNKRGSDLSYFYIASHLNLIKIGICIAEFNKINLYSRLYYVKDSIPSNNYEVFLGTVEDVANFECEVKIKFNPIKGTEWFSIDHLDEIRSMIPDTILPYSTQVI